MSLLPREVLLPGSQVLSDHGPGFSLPTFHCGTGTAPLPVREEPLLGASCPPLPSTPSLLLATLQLATCHLGTNTGEASSARLSSNKDVFMVCLRGGKERKENLSEIQRP